MKKVNVVVEIVETRKEKEIVSGYRTNFPLRKSRVVRNLRFYSAEAAIDWYYSQSFDPEIDWVGVTEWTVDSQGKKENVLSTILLWDTLSEVHAKENLRESRRRGIEQMFNISL